LDKRKAFSWRSANPATSLRKLAQLKGVGPLVGVVAFSGLAQFVLYTVWVLHNSFKFGWGPRENGWSLAAVGIVAVLVQGVLLGRLLKRFSPQKLAMWGLVSSAMAYTLWGAATEGWMMYAVIAVNLLGGTVTATVQRADHGCCELTQWTDGCGGALVGRPHAGHGVALSAR